MTCLSSLPVSHYMKHLDDPHTQFPVLFNRQTTVDPQMNTPTL